MTLSKREKTQRTREVLRLRKQGYDDATIAHSVGKSIDIVKSITAELRAAGKIEDRRKYNQGSGQKGKVDWENLESKNTKTLIEMEGHHATLKEMGKALKISGERVRQIRKLIRAQHSEDVFEYDEGYVQIDQAIDSLKITKDSYTRDHIRKICASGKISCRRRSRAKGSAWLIKDSDIKKLEQLLLPGAHKYICVICEKTFPLEEGQNSARKICPSPMCYAEYGWRMRAKYFNKKPSSKSLGGWYRDLLQRLKSHILPKNEKWVRIGRAIKKSGLTSMQLQWLRRRRIVSIRRDSTRSWRGRPVALYATSELKIASQVLRKWQARNGNKK